MSDTTPAPPADPAQGPPADAPPAADVPKDDDTDWKAEARKWEQRAKDNGAKATEFDKQRKAAMTDAERAVAEAETRGRTAATSEYGKRLATSEIRATAADAGADLAGVFDYLDLGRFVDESGEPDEKAIKSFVGGLPKKDPGTPSFDGGSRTTPPAGKSMSDLIRRSAGRA